MTEEGSSREKTSIKPAGGIIQDDDLDELFSLLNTDLSKPAMKKISSDVDCSSQNKPINLNKIISSHGGESLREAIDAYRLDPLSGMYKDGGVKISLADALDKHLVNPDSAAFVHPLSSEVLDIHTAIQNGHLQRTGHYMNTSNGKRLKLQECIDRYIIVLREVEWKPPDEEEDQTLEYSPGKYVIEVLDPLSSSWISAKLAIARGVYDQSKDRYFNSKTGELLTTQEAAVRNLLKLGSKNVDDSMDSNNTDVLLEGHEAGLKGLDINYSYEVVSDGEDVDLAHSSPRQEEIITANDKDSVNSTQFFIDESNKKGSEEKIITDDWSTESLTHKKDVAVEHIDNDENTIKFLESSSKSLSIDLPPLLSSMADSNGNDHLSERPIILKAGEQPESTIAQTDSSILAPEERFENGNRISYADDELDDVFSSAPADQSRAQLIAKMDALLERVKIESNGLSDNIKLDSIMPSDDTNSNINNAYPRRHASSLNNLEDDTSYPFKGEFGITLSFNSAVRLGLFNMKTGRFAHPYMKSRLNLTEACQQNIVDENDLALQDLVTGRKYSLRECVGLGLIDAVTGQISPISVKNFQLAIPNCFIPSLSSSNQPVNLIDSVKVGLLNPYTAEFTMPDTGHKVNLDEAVMHGYICSASTYVMHPLSGSRFSLADALQRGIVNRDTGDIMADGNTIISFNDALMKGVFGEIISPQTKTVLNLDTGTYLDFNSAVRLSILAYNSCLVYDTQQNKQVLYEEALASGIIDRLSASVVDKTTGTVVGCSNALDLGLVQAIGAPLCSDIKLDDAVLKFKPVIHRKEGILKLSNSDDVENQLPVDVITKQIVETERKKKLNKSSHYDNISATEYFVKGDIEIEINTEDESPLDQFEVKLTKIEPTNFIWESLPIKPLNQKNDFIEPEQTKSHPKDKEIIIIERDINGGRLPIQKALSYFNSETNTFSDPSTGEIMSVKQAIKHCIDGTQNDVEQAIEKYKMDMGSKLMIYTVTQPRTGPEPDTEFCSLLDAITCGHLNVHNGTFTNPNSKVNMDLEAAINRKDINGESAYFTNPVDRKIYSVKDSISNKIMDSFGAWQDPKRGNIHNR